jgi:hypothetical protein
MRPGPAFAFVLRFDTRRKTGRQARLIAIVNASGGWLGFGSSTVSLRVKPARHAVEDGHLKKIVQRAVQTPDLGRAGLRVLDLAREHWW